MSITWAVRLSVLLLCWSCQQSPKGRLPEFSLAERRRITLPDSFAVAGAAINDDHRIVAWSRVNRRVLLIDRKGAILEIGERRFADPFAAGFVGNELQVFDAQRKSVSRFDLDGKLISEAPMVLSVEVKGASANGKAWLFGVSDEMGEIRLIEVISGHAANGRPTLLSFEETTPTRLSISTREDGWIVSELETPYRSYSVQGSSVLAWPRLKLTAVEDGWVGLATLAIDSGYLRTFADLRSDHRVLVLFDHNRRYVRELRLNAPMAFIGTNETTRTLVATRRLQRFELVLYEWRWRDDTPIRR